MQCPGLLCVILAPYPLHRSGQRLLQGAPHASQRWRAAPQPDQHQPGGKLYSTCAEAAALCSRLWACCAPHCELVARSAAFKASKLAALSSIKALPAPSRALPPAARVWLYRGQQRCQGQGAVQQEMARQLPVVQRRWMLLLVSGRGNHWRGASRSPPCLPSKATPQAHPAHPWNLCVPGWMPPNLWRWPHAAPTLAPRAQPASTAAPGLEWCSELIVWLHLLKTLQHMLSQQRQRRWQRRRWEQQQCLLTLRAHAPTSVHSTYSAHTPCHTDAPTAPPTPAPARYAPPHPLRLSVVNPMPSLLRPTKQATPSTSPSSYCPPARMGAPVSGC